MNKLFTIGEMAKLFGINAKTLRYYDEIGLIRPEHTDPMTGYRYYSTGQFERLNTIKYLRALDMPLAKIMRFFENKDIGQMMEILKEQQEEVLVKRRELERIEHKISERLSQLHDALYTIYNQVEEVALPDRKLAMLRTEIPATDDLEYSIRQLERQTQLEAAMFLGKVGVSISMRHVMSHKFDEFCSIFVVLEPGDVYDGEAADIPGGRYLTLRYCGTHTQSSVYYEKLLSEMKVKGYELAGNSIEFTLVDAGMTNDTTRFVTELQLPVTVGQEYGLRN